MIAIGSDHAGYEAKEKVKKHLESLGVSFKDFGTHSEKSCDYPLIAKDVALSVKSGESEKGILICGSGIGMSIAANKVKGAYAALLTDVYSAQRSVLSNNANIACMGAFTIGGKLAEELLKTFLGLSFDPSSSSAPKVARYHAYDEAR